MEVKVTIEKSSDGTYSAFMEDLFPEFGLAGYGYTPKEAIDDFLLSYDETKDYLHKIGKEMPSITFLFSNHCNINSLADCNITHSLASI